MSNSFDIFCEIWVLTPSFFSTPLRSRYSNFQLSNYAGALAYILFYEKTKLFARQNRILFLDVFVSQYLQIFVDNIYSKYNDFGFYSYGK